MRTDGQTDMTKLTVAFRNFANAPKQGKDVPGYALKAYRKSTGITPLILNVGTRRW
jgi:hypothetical protein